MLTNPPASDEGAQASAAGALVTSKHPEHPEFVRSGPYFPDGLYVHGPRRAMPATTALDRLTRARCAETAETPEAARGRTASDRRRRLRLLSEGAALHAKAHSRLTAAVHGAFSRSRPARAR